MNLIVERALHSLPPAATQWSTRMLAKEMGVSHMTVARVWEAQGLQPHRVKTFKMSKDMRFVEKLTDVAGLYLNPPRELWPCAWMKSRRSRLWIGLNPACR